MQTEESRTWTRDVVDEFFADVLNGKDPSAARVLLTPGFRAHHSALKGGTGDAAAVAGLLAGFRSAFPDLHYLVNDHVVDGDRVAVRWTAKGTHHGQFMHVAPTGREVTIAGTDVFRLEDGRIAEAWVCSDMLGLLHQLGAFGS